MNKRTLVTLGVAGLTACISMVASANGLLGKHYLGAEVVSQNWGDSGLDATIGHSTGGSIVGNYNLNEHWDFNVVATGIWDSYDSMTSPTNTVNVDFKHQSALAGLNYLFPSDQPITPYIGGAVGFVRTKDDLAGSNSDTAFRVHVGAEWDMCEEAFFTLAATYDYIDNNDLSNNSGEYGLKAQTGIEVIDHLLLVGSAYYAFEKEDATMTVGLVIVQ